MWGASYVPCWAMIIDVPRIVELRGSSRTKRYSRSSGFFTLPAKLFTDLSMMFDSVSSLLGRLTVLSTAASRLRPGRSLFWTSRRTSMGHLGRPGDGRLGGVGTLHHACAPSAPCLRAGLAALRQGVAPLDPDRASESSRLPSETC